MDYRGWNGTWPERRLTLALPGLLAAYLLLTPAAWAALGSDTASVAADQAHFHASARVTTHALYEVHELVLATGTTVREYAVTGGRVFAVAWEGPAIPDLQQVLGASFADFVAAAQANQSGHHHLAATRGDLVLVSTGRMRAFIGRAYLASAVPPGVSIDEIR
jgi:hypothetical protein